MSDFLIPAMQRLNPYIPGEQPQDKQYIKLNTNENPYPPSQRVLDALSHEVISQLNLYSDPSALSLRRTIADQYELSPENVFTANGSDEVLGFAFRAFCDPMHPVTIPDISYGFYRVYAKLFETEAKQIPLNEDFTLPVDKFLHVNTTVAFANPNAPTGIALSLPDVEKIIASNQNHVVIVDEAYVDFGAESALSLLPQYPNLLVVRTYSKSYSLAGARLGYAFGSPEIISDLDRIRNSFHPYSINRMTMLAGIEAMLDRDHFDECIEKVKSERSQAMTSLRSLGFEVTDSQGNFLFAAHPALSGKAYYEGLKGRGILVRYWDEPRLYAHVRITVGTAEQMDALFTATKEILAEV